MIAAGQITDFGMSKDFSQHSQPRTKKVGTISYMAPEVGQATGDSPYDGAAADIWSTAGRHRIRI